MRSRIWKQQTEKIKSNNDDDDDDHEHYNDDDEHDDDNDDDDDDDGDDDEHDDNDDDDDDNTFGFLNFIRNRKVIPANKFALNPSFFGACGINELPQVCKESSIEPKPL